MPEITLAVEPTDTADILDLIETHRAFSLTVTPPEMAFAMPAHLAAAADMTMVAARDDGTLLGIGAVRELDPRAGEIKSMHTAEAARGRGIAKLVLDHLLTICRDRGYAEVFLETGSMPEMAAARRLYERAGFTRCAPYGEYDDNGINLCYSMPLT